MQLDKVRVAFEKKGYTPNAYIDKREYFRILNSLMVLPFPFRLAVANFMKKWLMNYGFKQLVNDLPNN